MLALFGRAEPRDFADVFQLAQRFGKEPLLAGAAELDRGFHREILAQILRSLAHIEDARLPVGLTRVPELRAFFAAWADELDGA